MLHWAIRFAGLSGLLGCFCAGVPAAHAQDIYPPLDSPKLHFEFSGKPDPKLPQLDGPDTTWRVAQWAKQQALDPAAMKAHPDVAAPGMFGPPLASVATPDGESAVTVYQHGGMKIFQLRSKGGIRQNGGSSNLFLTASPIVTDANFGDVISYDLQAKLPVAKISYATPQAEAQSGVIAHVFTGFTMSMPSVAGGPRYAVFLQVAQAEAKPEAGGFFSCSIAKGGKSVTVGYGVTPSADEMLPFASDKGGLHQLHYNLNDYLCAMVQAVPHCTDANGQAVARAFPAAAHDLKNWTLGGIYFGLETHNRDMRPNAKDHAVQGNVVVALDVADLHVTRDASTPAHCN